MSSKKTTRKISSKSILILLIIFLLSTYLIYNNISPKKVISNNSNSEDQLESKNNSKTQETYSNNDTNEIENTSYNADKNKIHYNYSFDESTLVNDNIGVPVLYYHSVKESADNEVTITPEKLKSQLTYLKNEGYVTLTLSKLKEYLLSNAPIPAKSIVITFDDGYMDNYYNAFPLLKDFNMVATIFCITSDLDGTYYLSKDAINEMSDYGIDIQSHTVTHPKLNKMTYDEQFSELKESKKSLESILGKEVDSIAYPFGDFNDDSIKAARDSGYTLGFTTKRGLSDRNDNPLKLDRIYISSNYDMDTFKNLLNKTEK